MQVTPYYAAILALFLVFISFRITLLRWKLRVSIGDGKDKVLRRAIRVHGNFIEYVPLTLMLIYFVEVQTGNATFVHVSGLCFLLARAMHAYGVSKVKEIFPLRFLGMLVTSAVICSNAIYLLATGAGLI